MQEARQGIRVGYLAFQSQKHNFAAILHPLAISPAIPTVSSSLMNKDESLWYKGHLLSSEPTSCIRSILCLRLLSGMGWMVSLIFCNLDVVRRVNQRSFDEGIERNHMHQQHNGGDFS
ncbi:conserved hypothetical protein [Ricinus communis]|uniref:Uncharacterized protein n=1 Tax=Ricinus communis TaxID=3988 RepID=B9RRH4_RICCO|nr:conserved hypothetical protein [Ricinus communis]